MTYVELDNSTPTFEACSVCNRTGVAEHYTQCKICCGFGTVIIYEERKDE
jgi:hypothetical protein